MTVSSSTGGPPSITEPGNDQSSFIRLRPPDPPATGSGGLSFLQDAVGNAKLRSHCRSLWRSGLLQWSLAFWGTAHGHPTTWWESSVRGGEEKEAKPRAWLNCCGRPSRRLIGCVSRGAGDGYRLARRSTPVLLR